MHAKSNIRRFVILFVPILLTAGLFLPHFRGLLNYSQNWSEEEQPLQRDSDVPTTFDSTNTAADGETLEGIIDPVLVEQAGYYSSSNQTGRTDTGVDTSQNLTIDEQNEWIGSRAELDVYSLNRLYVRNGSFDDGIAGKNQNPPPTDYNPYGWTANSDDGGTEENQFAAYEQQSDPYVTVENQAVEGGLFSDYYDHNTGTYVVWRQTVENAPFTTDFIFSFNYLYFSGPLYRTGGDDPGGDAWLIIAVDGSIVWNQSLLSLGSRNTWYNTGDVQLSLPSVGDSFTFSIGLYIADGMRLYSNRDYDNDGVNDGTGNAASIIAHLDDVSLIGSDHPSFESVELQFRAGTQTTDINGVNGVGNATIINSNFWTSDPLEVEILSNTSVEVQYRSRLLSHRFINSSWSTDESKPGVAFSVLSGESPEMTLFAYVGLVDPYEDFYVNFIYPKDWNNATVLNPFLSDVTSDTTSSEGLLTIPTELLSVLGWWKISFESPNYLQQKEVEMFNEDSWTSTTMLRPSNTSRVSVEIGSSSSAPILSSEVNVTWFQPNGTMWSEQQILNLTGSIGSTSPLLFGPLNTSAGLWTVTIVWTNGTEVAYGTTDFDFYRTATLEPIYDSLSADFGDVISNSLRYKDEETGEDLLETDASLSANWSTTTVILSPNFVRNWWEGDFDTGLVGGGTFRVYVNASKPYYDNVSASFTVESTYETTAAIIAPATETVEIYPNDTIQVTVNYTRQNGLGIEGGSLEITYTSTEEGLNWHSVQDYNNGSYSISILANTSAIYTITTTLSKTAHYPASDSFTLIVNELPTQISRLNGTADTVEFGKSYHLSLRYSNVSGYGLAGATVSIVGVSPFGLNVTEILDRGEGYYSLQLLPESADLYTILIELNIKNYESQTTTFSLNVEEIGTSLLVSETSSAAPVNQSYTLQLQYLDSDSVGLNGAQLELLNPDDYVSRSSFSDLGGGFYNVTLNSSEVGTYDLLFRASLPNYQNSSQSFTLVVTVIPAQVRLACEIASLSTQHGETVEAYAFYERTDMAVNITGATISVSPSASIGLDIVVNDYGSYYALELTGYQLGSWQLTITANKSDYQSATTSLILEVEAIASSVDIVNIDGLPVERGLNESFEVRFYYSRMNGSGIPDALVNLSYSSDARGLNWSLPVDYGNGTYSISVRINIASTYSVNVISSKEFYTTSFDSFTTVANEINTEISILNGTTGKARFGESFNLALMYTNASGYGLWGASVNILSVEPSSSLAPTTVHDLGDGCYTLVLDFERAGTYSLTIETNLTNHEAQIVTFTITVSEIPTVLRAIESSVTLAIDLSYTLTLSLEDDTGFGLSGAELELVNQPSAVTSSDWVDTGSGDYNVTLAADEVGVYDLLFRSQLANYQNSTETFTLLVTLIPSEIRVANQVSSLTVDYAEKNEIIVFFTRTDFVRNISDADISASADTSEVDISTVFEEDGYYVIRFVSYQLSPWQLSITANKTNHRADTNVILIQTDTIDTVLEGGNPAEDLLYMRSYNLTFSYLFQANQSGIPLSIMTPTGEAASWVTSTQKVPGQFSVNLTPESLGSHIVTLLFEREGFETRQFRLSFNVVSVPIEVVFVQGLTGYEGSSYDLMVQVREVDTQIPVTGASVTYRLFDSQGIGSEPVSMEETESGTYVAQLTMPDSRDSYTIRIQVEARNYDLESNATADVVPQTELGTLVVRTVSENIVPVLGVLGLTIGLVARSLYKKRRVRQNLEALAVKKRFDDANKLLGVIILHKESGIPIYSKMLRKGVDEGIISAFITAIRNFKLEFGLNGQTKEEGKLLPISDLIRAVSMKNLVFAFITVDSPSQQQRRNMVDFANSVAETFDQAFSDTPTEVLDPDTKSRISTLLQDIMDVVLLRRYRLRDDATLSKADECIKRGVSEFDDSEFLLDELAASIAECGFEEGRAYVSILDAVNDNVLVPTAEEVYTKASDEDEFVEEVETLLRDRNGTVM